jgi:hypothetical protein
LLPISYIGSKVEIEKLFFSIWNLEMLISSLVFKLN